MKPEREYNILDEDLLRTRGMRTPENFAISKRRKLWRWIMLLGRKYGEILERPKEIFCAKSYENVNQIFQCLCNARKTVVKEEKR